MLPPPPRARTLLSHIINPNAQHIPVNASMRPGLHFPNPGSPSPVCVCARSNPSRSGMPHRANSSRNTPQPDHPDTGGGEGPCSQRAGEGLREHLGHDAGAAADCGERGAQQGGRVLRWDHCPLGSAACCRVLGRCRRDEGDGDGDEECQESGGGYGGLRHSFFLSSRSPFWGGGGSSRVWILERVLRAVAGMGIVERVR
jgi:hypothetical protein